MNKNYEDEIKEFVSEIIEVPVEQLDSDADLFKDLNIDSLKAIEIVAAFEKKYRIIIPEEDIPNIRTIRQIIAYTSPMKKE